MTLLLAKIVWFIGVAAWYVIRRPYARRARKTATVLRTDRRREQVLLGGAFFGLFIVPLVYVLTDQPEFASYAPIPAQIILGALVFAGSLWLFVRAHKELGRQWSASLEIREKHALVRSGIYRHVRHPMYTSFWLWALAQAILLPNLIAGPIGLVSVGFLYFMRIGREEQMMLEAFGDDYRAYMAQTKRIVPGIY